MRCLYGTVWFVAAGLAACGGGPQAAPRPDAAVLLRLAPPVGQVTHYRTAEQSTVNLSMPMLGGPISTEQTRYYTYRVLDASGDRRVIERTVDSMVIDASGAPSAIRGTMEEAARATRGTRDTFTVDVTGRMIEAPDDAAPNAPAAGFDPTGLLDLLDHPMGLPEDPVRPGESWTVPTERREQVPEMGEMVVRVETIYQLERVEVVDGARHAFVRYDATIAMLLEPGPAAMVAMQMEFDGTESGELELDLDTGRVVRATSTAVADGAVAAMGMDLTMSMEMTAERLLLPARP